MATFPDGIFSWITLTDNTDDVLADHPNSLAAEIIALQTKVGINSSAIIASHDYKFTHLPIQVQNWDIGSFELRAQTLYLDKTGVKAITLESDAANYVITYLNADKLDGNEATAFYPAQSGDVLFTTVVATRTGWTQVTSTYDNKFIRISTGTALETGGLDTHDHGGTAGNTTLTVAQIPAHTHTYNPRSNLPGSGPGAGETQATPSENTGSTGGGSSHTHIVTSADNIPAYIQVKMYTKD